MHKPLHDMTDAEAIAAYGTEPTRYESVGQWEDSGEIDRRYAEKIHSGMDHYAAKVQAFEETMGREYPHGRPGGKSERDKRIAGQYAFEQQMKNVAQKHNAELRQINEKHKKQNGRRMAGILFATALAGGGTGLLMDYLNVDNI